MPPAMTGGRVPEPVMTSYGGGFRAGPFRCAILSIPPSLPWEGVASGRRTGGDGGPPGTIGKGGNRVGEGGWRWEFGLVPYLTRNRGESTGGIVEKDSVERLADMVSLHRKYGPPTWAVRHGRTAVKCTIPSIPKT